MADYADIMLALLTRASTLSIGSPALPIAMPERPLDPPADGKYLQVEPFINAPAWNGLNGGRMDQGLMQITVVWPRNEGLIGASDVVDAVCAHFTAGLSLHQGGATVKITQDARAASPLSEGSELRIPVTIPWKAA